MIIEENLSVCGPSLPNIQKILMCDYYLFEGYNLNADRVITSLNGSQTWVTWDFDYKSCNFNEDDNGSNYPQTFQLVIQKVKNETKLQLEKLKARRVIIIFEDSNSIWHFSGENGLKMNSKTISIGNDNKYLLTLQTIANSSMKDVLTSYAKSL